MLIFQLRRVRFSLQQEDCQDHQFLFLKHQDQCLVTVMQNTKYSLTVKYLEWN